MKQGSNKFKRIAIDLNGTIKLCSRSYVNQRLAFADAYNTEVFLLLLSSKFGEPDKTDDLDFFYGIHDEESGIDFIACSGPSGPSYRGWKKYFNNDEKNYLLRHEIKLSLFNFEKWLTDDSDEKINFE